MEAQCPQCSSRLRVPDDAAAKKVRCPSCQSIITLAGGTPEVAIPGPNVPAPRLAAVAAAQWSVKMEDGQQYGPISKTELDRWVADGRLGPECQLLKSGAPQWQWASDVYPQLASSAAGPPAASAPPVRGSSAGSFPNVDVHKPAGGAPFIATDNPYASPGIGGGSSHMHKRRVPDILPWAIFSLICCGGIFAVPAIVYAAQANSMKARGDYMGAARAAASAQTWLYVAIGIGVAANILAGLMMAATG
jgi:predicted Zn finger-like uncharacterized protein